MRVVMTFKIWIIICNNLENDQYYWCTHTPYHACYRKLRYVVIKVVIAVKSDEDMIGTESIMIVQILVVNCFIQDVRGQCCNSLKKQETIATANWSIFKSRSLSKRSRNLSYKLSYRGSTAHINPYLIIG